MASQQPDHAARIDGLRAGDRRALARAITLVESRRPADREAADALVLAAMPHTGKAWRIGVSGVPGAGKSSLLETLGTRLCREGHHVAVLAVDPSSAISGGSILGDKTRMEQLAREPNAFVRPSPGGDTLGGIAARTREAMLLCEAAGFDVVFVETIGVGQNEHAVAELVDFFLLLVLAGAGDELQGIKRGILELADGVAVTKADGDNLRAARDAATELDGALHILRGNDAVPVWTCSARSGDGIATIWDGIRAQRERAESDGSLQSRRRRQDEAWFDRALDEAIRQRFLGEAAMRARVAELRAAVGRGTTTPLAAVRGLLGPES